MPVLQIVAAKPPAGKTTALVALAQGFAAAGHRVTIVRSGDSPSAAQDAETFTAFSFAGTPGHPVSADEVRADAGLVLVETDAGAQLPAAPAILVVRGEPGDEDVTLARSLGGRLIGTIATAVPPSRVEAVARELTNRDLRPIAILPEDRVLAAPSVGEIRDALGAEVLYEGENELETVSDVIIAPVYADPARPHFRRFAAKAVIAPFNKTDLHLAAIETQARCLIISGGRDPSPYVIDRAQGEATTVLLAPEETPETVAALGEAWLKSRFRGELKAQAAFAHLEGRVDFAALASRLS
jgi:hypothetical protein